MKKLTILLAIGLAGCGGVKATNYIYVNSKYDKRYVAYKDSLVDYFIYQVSKDMLLKELPSIKTVNELDRLKYRLGYIHSGVNQVGGTGVVEWEMLFQDKVLIGDDGQYCSCSWVIVKHQLPKITVVVAQNIPVKRNPQTHIEHKIDSNTHVRYEYFSGSRLDSERSYIVNHKSK